MTVASCVSTKVSRRNNYDYSVLKPDHKYIVKTKTRDDIRQFTFKEETDSLIIGIYKNEEMQIEKNDIIVINKFSWGKTIPTVLASAAVIAIIITAAVIGNPVSFSSSYWNNPM
jgi:hypothetical protein